MYLLVHMLCTRFTFLFWNHFFFFQLCPKETQVCDAMSLLCGCPQVSTFIMMYRTHCQRILDTVIRANFDEARVLLFDVILCLRFCFHALY